MIEILQLSLIVTTLLCSLVAGFLFAFAFVVMPGIRKLNDREFSRAFQVIDLVIQNNQPVFILVWVGSIISLVASTLLGINQLEGAERLLLILITLVYLLGVQLPTALINIPLNKRLQSLDVETMSGPELSDARYQFEPRWNLSNRYRTAFATLASILLIILLFML